MGHAGGQDRADGEDGRQREQAAVGRARGVLHQADQVGPHEPAEVPDRVDQGDARGRGRPAEQRGGHGPEDGMRAQQEEETDGERPDGRDRRDDGGEREGHGGDGQRDRHVELALAGAIRMARDEHEAHDRHRVGDGGHEALADVAEASDLVDDLADPERQPVDVDDHAEVQEAEHEHATVLERVADRVVIALQACRLLALQAPRQPLLLVGPQPGRLGGAVVEVAPHEDAAQDGRHGLDQEQPLPVLQPGGAVEDRHDRTRERRADRVGDRDGGHEEAHGAGALAGREPVGEVEDHAGEEAGLRHAQQEAHGVEAHGAGHEQRAGRDDPPRDHDARDPLARAELVQREVAGDLEEEVGDEEDAGAEAVDGAGEAEVGLEPVLGEGHVHPIQVGDDVEAQQDRYEADRDLAHRPRL